MPLPDPSTTQAPSVLGVPAAQDWLAPVAAGPLDAVVHLPGSKSLTNRYLVLAALAADVSRLRRPLRSRDTELMASALRALGCGIEDVGEADWLVTPSALLSQGRVDCGLAGNVMRFVPPVAALAVGDTVFDGDEAARHRPMAPVLAALRTLGADLDDGGRCQSLSRRPAHSAARPRRRSRKSRR